MPEEVHLHVHFEERLYDLLERIHSGQLVLVEEIQELMSAVSDFATKVNANFASIKAGIAALDAKIQAFQNSPGTLSPADQTALDDIVATSATLATAANAAVPVVTPTP
jgi:prophage DNA circulation protein